MSVLLLKPFYQSKSSYFIGLHYFKKENTKKNKYPIIFHTQLYKEPMQTFLITTNINHFVSDISKHNIRINEIFTNTRNLTSHL